MEIRSDREFRFDLPRADLWRTLSVVEDYPCWWPWLRRFDAAALAPGQSWDCVLRPPLPYPIRCVLHLDAVVEPELVVATLSGDLIGQARVDLQPDTAGDATVVRLRSELTAAAGSIRLVSRLVPRLARRAHDWVLDSGARQFRSWHVDR